MYKICIYSILFLATTLGANAQFSVSYTAGYGSYKMGDMKKLLESAFQMEQGTMPAGLRIVDNFPAYVTQSVDFTYMRDRMEWGVTGTFMTTGGKIAYSDYSGKYVEKLTLTGYRIGATYRYYLSEGKLGKFPLLFYGEVSPAVTFTNLKYSAAVDIYEGNIHEEANDNVSTKAKGWSVLPALGSKLFLTRKLALTANIGYDIEFGSKLSTTSNTLRVDWSGLRLNGGATIMF